MAIIVDSVCVLLPCSRRCTNLDRETPYGRMRNEWLAEEVQEFWNTLKSESFRGFIRDHPCNRDAHGEEHAGEESDYEDCSSWRIGRYHQRSQSLRSIDLEALEIHGWLALEREACQLYLSVGQHRDYHVWQVRIFLSFHISAIEEYRRIMQNVLVNPKVKLYLYHF